MKYKYLPIVLLLTSCIETVEVPVQINPYACVDGWQWTLEGSPIVDEQGNQLTCIVNK